VIFNTDKGTGKPIPRSLIDRGDAMPTQFDARNVFNGTVGTTVNLGSMAGGGMGRPNTIAGQAIGNTPPFLKKAMGKR